MNEPGTNSLVRGDFKQAEGNFVRMIAIYEKVYAGKHYLIGIAKSNRASVFLRRDEWVRAEALFRESLTVVYANAAAGSHQRGYRPYQAWPHLVAAEEIRPGSGRDPAWPGHCFEAGQAFGELA